jgi:uncharacterized protein YggE
MRGPGHLPTPRIARSSTPNSPDYLGKVISISEAPGSSPPMPAVPMPRGAMATEMPLQPGEQTVSFTVTAVWELT